MGNLFVVVWVSASLILGLLSSYKLYHDRKLTIKLLLLNICISFACAAIGACFLLR